MPALRLRLAAQSCHRLRSRIMLRKGSWIPILSGRGDCFRIGSAANNAPPDLVAGGLPSAGTAP